MYNGPIAVTLAYFGVYYAFQVNQLFVKRRLARDYASRGERFDRYFGNDREMLAADRYVGNALEHMGPFLTLLWLNATLLSAQEATLAGSVYVLSRAAYPFLMGKRLGRGVPTRIMLTTVLGYTVIAFFSFKLLMALF